MRKLSLILAMMLIFATIGCAFPSVAFAAPDLPGQPNVGIPDPTLPKEDEETNIDTSKYSNVLDDLQKDATFDVGEYPEIYGDYGLEVIQVAESTAGELFVYVYQHSADPLCEALSIRISQTVGENLAPHDYDLLLLNVDSENKTIVKYLVEGITLKQDVQRYYEIIQITREYIEGYDKEVASGQIVNEFAINVSKLFTLTTINGVTTFTMEKAETREIKDLCAGTVLLRGKSFWDALFSGDFTENALFFLAFSVDFSIDSIEEATVCYDLYDFEYYDTGWNYLFHDYDPDKWYFSDGVYTETTIKNTLLSITTGGSITRHKYNVEQISSMDQFLSASDVEFDSDVKTAFRKYDWVLLYFNSTIYEHVKLSKYVLSGQYADNASILRLKYWTEGVSYNVGIISNKQTDDDGIDNVVDDPFDGWEKFFDRFEAFFDSLGAFFSKVGAWCTEYWWVLAIIGGVIAIAILSIFLKPVWFVVKWIFKILWLIISALPRLIVLIVNKIKEKRE